MKKMKNKRSLLATAALTVIFFTGSARAADLGTQTQNLISRAIEANINDVAAGTLSDPAVFRDIQNSMMTKISDAVKKNTAERKRATVIKTCMECRAMQPIKVVVSGQSSFLGADIQERINQAMAKKIEETIRVTSSDPAVARIVQESMMAQRMAASPLRQEMQPFMMSSLLPDPGAMNVANNNAENGNNSLNKTMCAATDSRFPNC